MHKQYIDKIMMSKDLSKYKKMGCLLKDAIDYFKDNDKEEYEEMETKLYEIAEGKILNEEKAKCIIDKMKPYGMHWTLEQTEAVRKSNGLSSIRPVDFWIVMNSEYNDNSKTIGKYIPADKQVAFYTELSKDFILDEDADEDKVYKYFTEIPKKY